MRKEFKGYGGGKVVIDGDNIFIKEMFMKEDCDIKDIKNVSLTKPLGLNNGNIKIETKKLNHIIVFLKRDLNSFMELYDLLNGNISDRQNDSVVELESEDTRIKNLLNNMKNEFKLAHGQKIIINGDKMLISRLFGKSLILSFSDITYFNNIPPVNMFNGQFILEAGAEKISDYYDANKGEEFEALFHLLEKNCLNLQISPQILNFKNFIPSKMHCNYAKVGVYVDEENRNWYYGNSKVHYEMSNYKGIPNIYKLDEIADVWIEEYGIQTSNEITKKHGIGRAIVGGAIAGVGGAVVGAVTGNEKTTGNVIQSTNAIVHWDRKLDDGNIEVYMIDRFSLAGAKQIEKFMRNLIVEDVAIKDSTDNTIEKLREYKKLLDEGIVTEEEFSSMKKQLLGL